MLKRFAIVGFSLLLGPIYLTGKDKPDAAPVFPEVTARGRALYEYDQAAQHASDAVRAVHPDRGVVRSYIARKSDSGWTVVFGRLNDQRDKFLIAYEAIQGKTIKEFMVRKVDPPVEESGFYLGAAKAIDTALHDFKGAARPYSGAVLPAPSNQFYVYMYPSQTQDGVYPVGGDVRYLISSDGNTVIDERRMHSKISEGWDKPPNLWVGNYHTHDLSSEPEDTDVFHVLSSKVPEYIGTPNGKFFRVNTDGTIVEVKKGSFADSGN
ncbi:MAG TPA: hypothetical protein VF753_22460 [Terriglobales bacterium]